MHIDVIICMLVSVGKFTDLVTSISSSACGSKEWRGEKLLNDICFICIFSLSYFCVLIFFVVVFFFAGRRLE